MRLTYDDLQRLESQLFQRFSTVEIDADTYLAEWDALVLFAGWTWEEVLLEIDARWTTPFRPHSAFLC